MPDRRDHPTGTRLTLAAVLAAVLCCAAPVLLGALGIGVSGAAIGAFIANPVVIVIGLMVLGGAGALIVLRSHRRR